MNLIRLLPVIFSILLMAAHFSRAGSDVLALFCLLLPLLLFIRKKWLSILMQALLILGSFIWIYTIWNFAHLRQETGQPWGRLVLILSMVALFTAGSALVFRTKGLRKRYH